MQAAGDTFDEQVVPKTAGTVDGVNANVAGLELGADRLVIASLLRWRLGERGMNSASPDSERPAHLCRRPYLSLLRAEGGPHFESFAK